MTKTLLTTLFSFIFVIVFSQQKDVAENLVNEGVTLHDKGDYQGAILKYNTALIKDENNYLALSEKAFTLLTLGKMEEAIVCCDKIIELYSGIEEIGNTYVTYGNALDQNKKPEDAIDMYNEGIRLYPDYYQLHFNKGITLATHEEISEALVCFETSVKLNPSHAGSHNAIARLQGMNKKRIPSIMAYCRFLVVEPQGKRASENLSFLLRSLSGNVDKTGKNSITINISSDLLGDSTADGKPMPNNFSSTDLILSLTAAMDFDKKNKKKTQVELFTNKIEILCSSLKETQEKNTGFYWEFYAPYFIDMKDQDMLETFSYIAFASSDESYVSKWLKANNDKVKKFYQWSNDYNW